MNFKKYQHLERFGTTETEGIEQGFCYIFPKIDGSNASVWRDDEGELCAGSRNRQLTLEKDNSGFLAWVLKNEDTFSPFFQQFPETILYGEWLIPHTLKTYREDAWRDFYVFDVLVYDKYIPFEGYKEELLRYNISFIPPLCFTSNPTEETLFKMVEKNTFLIEDKKGIGEGIVIKNYDFVNKFGRVVWAKIVTNKFKDENKITFGVPEQKNKKQIEVLIAKEYVTEHLCEKVYSKIINQSDGWSSRYIPRLLNTIYYDIIREEMWSILKKHKYPTIDFKKLQKHVYQEIKTFFKNKL